MLIGAGVGALGSAITGNNPFKGAALGAAGGGLGSAAGLFGGATGGATAAGTTAAELLPTSLAVAPESLAASSPLFGYTASGVSPFLGAAEASMIPTASSIGAGFGADTIANMAVTDPTFWEQIKPYATINNLSGAANIASKFQPKPFSSAPQGRVSQGQAPAGGLGQGGVEGLLAEIEKQRQQTQRQPISLLVG